jgi:hypothetical protein
MPLLNPAIIPANNDWKPLQPVKYRNDAPSERDQPFDDSTDDYDDHDNHDEQSETKESFWRDVQYVFSSSIAELRGEPIPPRVVGKGKKPFVYAVNDFVLGPDLPIFDVQAEQRTIAAFLQANGGHLTAGHIVALTGATYHEAEATFVQVLVRFGGDALVREDGLIVAEFPHFVPTQHSLPPATNFEFYSDRHEEPITLTGNTAERNRLIALLNSFNLVMSVFSYVYFLEASWILTSVLSLFPFAVSSLFFLIPIARVPFVEHAETERLSRLLRRTMMGTILWSGKTEFRRDDFITAVHSVDARREQEVILNKLLVELEGEVTLDEESGVPVYRFPRLIAETR